MQTIQISPDVQAQELGAIEAFLRTRLLVQAQAIEGLKAQVAARDEEMVAIMAKAAEEIEAMRAQLCEIESRMAVGALEGGVE